MQSFVTCLCGALDCTGSLGAWKLRRIHTALEFELGNMSVEGGGCRAISKET